MVCIGLYTEASISSHSCMYCPNLGQLRRRVGIRGHVASGGVVLPAGVPCAMCVGLVVPGRKFPNGWTARCAAMSGVVDGNGLVR
jgi:hypothetical protein